MAADKRGQIEVFARYVSLLLEDIMKYPWIIHEISPWKFHRILTVSSKKYGLHPRWLRASSRSLPAKSTITKRPTRVTDWASPSLASCKLQRTCGKSLVKNGG
jgi:hypothetical protein